MFADDKDDEFLNDRNWLHFEFFASIWRELTIYSIKLFGYYCEECLLGEAD